MPRSFIYIKKKKHTITTEIIDYKEPFIFQTNKISNRKIKVFLDTQYTILMYFKLSDSYK